MNSKVYKSYRTYSDDCMSEKRKLLGISKLSTDNKMTLIERAVEILSAKKGDIIAFYEENGKVCVEIT